MGSEGKVVCEGAGKDWEGEAPAEPRMRSNMSSGSRLSGSFALPLRPYAWVKKRQDFPQFLRLGIRNPFMVNEMNLLT